MPKDGFRRNRQQTIPHGKSLALLLAVGFVAGFFNGLIGSGGGTVIFVALAFLGYGTTKQRLRCNLACVGVMSAISLIFYRIWGRFTFAEAIPSLLLPAAIGGLIGAYLAERIRAKRLRYLFGILVLFGGVRMMLRS